MTAKDISTDKTHKMASRIVPDPLGLASSGAIAGAVGAAGTKARLGGRARSNRRAGLQKYAMRRPHAAVANQIVTDRAAHILAAVGNGAKA
jgi:hypothetical protein